MVRQLIYGGIGTRDFKRVVDGSETYSGPERDYESVPIPGRNGELTIDNGRYQNVDIPYSIRFSSAALMEAFREKVLSLTGYQRLEDNKRPDEYRLARISEFSPSMNGVENRHSVVDITFNCMPQRFLKVGEKGLTISGESLLHNLWGMDARPLIRVYGTGKLTVGDISLTVLEHGYPYMDIDCERGDAYYTGENLNSKIERDSESFPVLSAGDTQITLDGIERIIIYPRWWKL